MARYASYAGKKVVDWSAQKGIENPEKTIEIAIELTKSPLLEHIHTLDLSLGVLDDSGASALLFCPAVHKLRVLDIHHYYCSDEMMKRLEEELNIPIYISDQQVKEKDDDRYVAVGE